MREFVCSDTRETVRDRRPSSLRYHWSGIVTCSHYHRHHRHTNPTTSTSLAALAQAYFGYELVQSGAVTGACTSPAVSDVTSTSAVAAAG